jgi:hypothetical protein
MAQRDRRADADPISAGAAARKDPGLVLLGGCGNFTAPAARLEVSAKTASHYQFAK